MKQLFICLSIIFFCASCRPETYVPKPRGYYHIEFPQHEYQRFDEPGFPYSFEYPTYGHIIKDTVFFGEKPENPYWININFPGLGGQIYLSYKEINADQPYIKLIEDTYDMTQFHTKKADYIAPLSFYDKETGVHGELYNVTGNAASAYQFFASDSVKHFLRGALYFNVTPNADSLEPVNDFLRQDMERMLKTLSFR